MFALDRKDGIFTLTLSDGENRFNNGFLDGFHAQLDAIEAQAGDGPAGLIVTGEGKFWSNGIDLEWLGGAGPEDVERFLPTLHRLMGRLVSFPLPTLAALNGHTFAGGALLALTFDYRVMRTGRGWVCLPEVDIGIPFRPPMMSLLKAKLPPATLRDAVLGGPRFTGDEALAAGIVDATCPVEELPTEAARRIAPLSEKKRQIFATMKRDLYGALAHEFGHTPTLE